MELASSASVEPACSLTPEVLPQPYQQPPVSTATQGYWLQQPAPAAPAAAAPTPANVAVAPASPAPAAAAAAMPSSITIPIPGRFTAADARSTARFLRRIAEHLDDTADELEA